MYIESVPNRNSPPAILLRESYWSNGKVCKRTLANLSSLPADAIEALRKSIRGVKLTEASKDVSVEKTMPCGHINAIRKAMERLGMSRLLSSRPCMQRDIILAVIAQRLVEPATKLGTVRMFENTTVREDFGLGPNVNEDSIYEAMDWLLARQPHIERKLASRHLKDGGMAFYDLSCSSYHGSTCPLAKRGHNRDGLKLPAVEYGLLTDSDGRPVAVQVYEGNTSDPKTVPDQVKKLRDSFGIDKLVLVGDRGMLTGAQIEDLAKTGDYSWISCLRSTDIRKLIASRDPSDTPLFSKTNIAQISHPDFPGERLIACHNPFLAEDRRRTREELLAATEKHLDKVRRECERRTRTPIPDAQVGEKVGRVINLHNMAKHFTWVVKDGRLSFSRNVQSIEEEQRLDGIYVIRTNVPSGNLSDADVVRAYKMLGNVEKAFRTFKGVDIHIRPIHHRLEDRVRAHIFLCMLTYYVEWHMRRALSPLMYSEDDLQTARQLRDPVAKAQPSPETKRKKRTKKSTGGLSLNTWRGLISTLGTISRVNLRISGNSINIVQETKPNNTQSEVFRLLDEKSSIWPN